MESPPLVDSAKLGDRIGIQMNLRIPPSAIFYAACTPVVSVDGIEYAMKWGQQFLDVLPGLHKIEIYFRYAWIKHCGYATINVELSETQPCALDYFKNEWTLGKGKVTRLV